MDGKKGRVLLYFLKMGGGFFLDFYLGRDIDGELNALSGFNCFLGNGRFFYLILGEGYIEG